MSTNTRNNFGDYNSGTYSPANEDISTITQAAQATVTTSSDHSFVVGNQVQFLIPSEWGMRQLSGRKGFVISIPSSTQIVVNIDTRNFDAFVTPSPPSLVVIDPAQVAGVGDQNFGSSSPGGVFSLPLTIQGAYLNQPP